MGKKNQNTENTSKPYKVAILWCLLNVTTGAINIGTCFLAVDKAYKLLLDQEQKKRALDVIQAGKEYVEHTVSIP